MLWKLIEKRNSCRLSNRDSLPDVPVDIINSHVKSVLPYWLADLQILNHYLFIITTATFPHVLLNSYLRDRGTKGSRREMDTTLTKPKKKQKLALT